MQVPMEFKTEMDKTGKLFRIAINKETVDWYWGYLKRFNLSTLQKAFDDANTKEEHFPSIATIRKYADSHRSGEQRSDFPTYNDLKKSARTGLAREYCALTFDILDRKITKEEFGVKLEQLNEKWFPVREF